MVHERFVIDTNVFLSGLLFATTTPARAVERAIRAIPEHQVLASRETLRELTGKLLSPKFDRYVERARRMALLDRLAPNLVAVETVQRMRAGRDPKDATVLEVAVNGSPSPIVTGDREFPSLLPFRGIDISCPKACLDRAA
jgi:putative PIN family toxin of toxin-antitoxin system